MNQDQDNHRSSLFQSTSQLKPADPTSMKNYQVDQIKNLLEGAKSALIAVPQLSIDSAGAALALALLLKKKGLNVQVFSPQKPDANYSKLSGLDLITDKAQSKDLIVSLNYPLDQIDQVSYNDDGGRLNLVVKTKDQAPQVQSDQIVVQNQSATADINFMLGDESSLGDAADMVKNGKWVLISPLQANKSWAQATLVDPDAPFSEIFTFLLPMLGFDLDADSGKDLLIGLRVATQSFSVNVSPETFEAGATCLRATQQQAGNQPANPEPKPIEAVETAPSTNLGKPSSVPTA